MYRVLSLFAGIGGFDLGLERTGGFKTVAFCEIDPFCQRVLAKHWPGVPCYDDVRQLTAERLREDNIAVDVICGGFPCQEISSAGTRLGLSGERSGLWSEYARIAGELRPKYIVIENVAALSFRGLATILGRLAALGYDAEWHCIPAASVGAPIPRDRLWIVAFPTGGGLEEDQPLRSAIAAALEGVRRTSVDLCGYALSVGDSWLSDAHDARVDHGLPFKTYRLRGLGNAVVPQIPEMIGRAILASEAA